MGPWYRSSLKVVFQWAATARDGTQKCEKIREFSIDGSTDQCAKFVFAGGSHRPRPLICLCRSLIDKITPTTRSRQSLIDKRRFGAIPRTRIRIDKFVCTMAVNLNESVQNPSLHVFI